MVKPCVDTKPDENIPARIQEPIENIYSPVDCPEGYLDDTSGTVAEHEPVQTTRGKIQFGRDRAKTSKMDSEPPKRSLLYS